jgi:hypothetical protein
MFDIPPFDEVYELDYDGEVGGILGFHLRGHGHSPDVIDRFLNVELPEFFDTEDPVPTEWEVTETWARKVPIPSTGGWRYAYCNGGRGAYPITLVEPRGWWYWCVNHPDERATIGVSATRVVDGEQIVAEHLAALADAIDPRADVSQGPMGGYVYLCRACSERFYERERQARAAAQRGAA